MLLLSVAAAAYGYVLLSCLPRLKMVHANTATEQFVLRFGRSNSLTHGAIAEDKFLEMPSRASELCPHALSFEASEDHETKKAFRLTLQALPPGAAVRVCEQRQGEHAGVILIENFLTQAEVASLQRQLRHQAREDMRTETMNSAHDKPSLLLEARLSAFTSVPHVDNDGCIGFLQVHDWENQSTSELHLDMDLYERTPVPWLSALFYLEEPESGGHTIFPLLAVPGAKDSDGRSEKLREAVHHELAQRGRFPLNNREERWGGNWKSNATERMCQDLKDADASGRWYKHFGVPPTPGSALLFWHVLADGTTLDRMAFHTGCGFQGRKVFLQSFRAPSQCWFDGDGWFTSAEQCHRHSHEEHCRRIQLRAERGTGCTDTPTNTQDLRMQFLSGRVRAFDLDPPDLVWD